MDMAEKVLVLQELRGKQYFNFYLFRPEIKTDWLIVAGILIFFSFTRFITQGKLYHGHYRLNGINDLAPYAQEALRKNNIINGKGKFIK